MPFRRKWRRPPRRGHRRASHDFEAQQRVFEALNRAADPRAAAWHRAGNADLILARNARRAALRVVALGLLDLAVLVVVPLLLAPAGVGRGVAALLTPLARLGVLGLLLVGAYGPGDARRSPSRTIAGVGLGILVLRPLLAPTALWPSAAVLVCAGVVLCLGRWAADRIGSVLWPPVRCRAVVVQAEARSGLTERLASDPTIEVVSEAVVAGGEAGVGQRIAAIARDAGASLVVLSSAIPTRAQRGIADAVAVLEVDVWVEVPAWGAGGRPLPVRRPAGTFLQVTAPGLRYTQLVAKRLLDLVGSGTLLLVLSPVFLTVALLVRLTSPGPAVFGHVRLGRHGRPFRCFKFRSMYPDAEHRLRTDAELWAEYVANDYKLPPDRDPRITRVGRLLRRTSLDELPQLWNVLRGDMSLVGPRPIVAEELAHYGPRALMLLQVKPGMTGLWQVSGRSNVPYPERTDLELAYVERWTLAHDLEILLRTVPAVLASVGAH